jgi:hypothetical protein
MAGVVAVKQLDGFRRREFLFFTRQRFNDIPLRNGTYCIEIMRDGGAPGAFRTRVAGGKTSLSSSFFFSLAPPRPRQLLADAICARQHPLALAHTESEYDDR